jgi:hypothetical protein
VAYLESLKQDTSSAPVDPKAKKDAKKEVKKDDKKGGKGNYFYILI